MQYPPPTLASAQILFRWYPHGNRILAQPDRDVTAAPETTLVLSYSLQFRLLAAHAGEPETSLLFSDDVNHKGGVRVAFLRGRKLSVAFLRLFVGAFPVDSGTLESCFEQQLPNLGQGPEPPVIGEGLLDL